MKLCAVRLIPNDPFLWGKPFTELFDLGRQTYQMIDQKLRNFHPEIVDIQKSNTNILWQTFAESVRS